MLEFLADWAGSRSVGQVGPVNYKVVHTIVCNIFCSLMIDIVCLALIYLNECFIWSESVLIILN